MAIPSLVADPLAKYHSSATGVPANGANVFALGILPLNKVNPDRLKFTVTPQGPSVTGATFVSYNSLTGMVTMSFVQGGVDAVRIDAELVHSINW
jgi:hypothetical protein